MALDLSTRMRKKPNKHLRIGYGRFLYIKTNFIKSLGYILSLNWGKFDIKTWETDFTFSYSADKEESYLILEPFLMHPDCDGVLKYSEIHKMVKYINTLSEEAQKTLEDLWDMFKFCDENKCNLYFT